MISNQTRNHSLLLLFVVSLLHGGLVGPAFSDSVDISWNVDSKQYLVYGEYGQKEVFDLFGYELTDGTVAAPHPALAYQKGRLPEYFSLFLPSEPLEVGDSFTYERRLTEEEDPRFYPFIRWIPAKVKGQGKIKKKVQLEGETTYFIHQTIEAEMPDDDLQEMREVYKGNWMYGDTLTMEVDQWFDPTPGLLRKIKYSARYSFKGKRSRKGEEENSYSLSVNHKIAGTFRDDSFERRVQEAIDQGRKFVLKRQEDDGTWDPSSGWDQRHVNYPAGETALALLTLIECGVPTDQPAVKEGMKWLIEQPPKRTYSSALALMAMDSYKENPMLRRYEQKFILGEIDRSTFEEKKKELGEHESLTKKEQEWVVDHTKFLVSAQGESGGWRYKADSGGSDNSNSQYGALGLNAAASIGARIPPGVWKKVIKHWVKKQAPEGPRINLALNMFRSNKTSVVRNAKVRGWTYREAESKNAKGKPIYGKRSSVHLDMTVGGLGSLKLAIANLANKNVKLSPELVKSANKALRDGWAWTQANWTLRPTPGGHLQSGWHMRQYYTLYGLERAGMFTRTRAINGHNWYEEGAELLLARQQEDGSWGYEREQGTKIVSTCFALLFLKRASSPVLTKSPILSTSD